MVWMGSTGVEGILLENRIYFAKRTPIVSSLYALARMEADNRLKRKAFLLWSPEPTSLRKKGRTGRIWGTDVSGFLFGIRILGNSLWFMRVDT